MGMKARLTLAALHYNANNRRGQKRNKEGELSYSIKYLKYKDSCIVRPVTAPPCYEYVDNLLSVLFTDIIMDTGESKSSWSDIHIPEALATTHKQYKTLNKQDAISRHVSRFPKS